MTDLDLQIKLAAQDLATPTFERARDSMQRFASAASQANTSLQTSSSHIQRAGSSLDDLGKSASGAHGFLSGITQMASNGFGFAAGIAGFKGLQLAAGGVGESVIGLNATLEQNKVAFTTMLGSAGAADKMLEQLADFAAATPFEFKDLTEGTKRMLAFGFSAEQVLPMLTSIGDAAAGLGLSGAEGINRIGLALGQMQAKTKVSADEMLQLTEIGVPAWDILAKGIGHTTAETQKLAEKGLIPASIAIDLLTTGMEQRFPDMMAKQSQTFNGLMSTLHDNVTMGLAKMGESIFNVSKDALSSLVNLLSSPAVKEAAQQVGAAIGAAVTGAAAAIKGLVQTAGPLIQQFASDPMAALRAAFQTVQDVMSPFAPTAERVKGAVDDVRTAVQQFIGPIQTSMAAWKDEQVAAVDARATLEKIAGVVNGMSQAVEGATGFIRDHREAQIVLGAAIGAATTAYALMTASQIAMTIATTASTLATQIMTAAQLALNVAMTANPVGIVIVALGALAGALIVAYNTSDEFRAKVDAAFAAAKEAVSQFWEAAQPIIKNIGDAFQEVARIAQQALSGDVSGAIRRVGQDLKDAIPNIATALGEWTGELFKWGSDAASKIPGIVGGIVDAVKDWVSGLGKQGMSGAGSDMGDAILDGLKNAITVGVPGFFSGLKDLVGEAIKAFMAGFGRGSGGGAQVYQSGLRLQTDYGATAMPSAAAGGSFSPFDAIFRKYAGDLASDPRFIAIVAAGTKAESGWDPSNTTGDSGHSWGLFQMHDQGAGAGMGASRLDPDVASSVMVPKYAQAYRQSVGKGLRDEDLAALVAALAERPEGYDIPGSPARQRYMNAYRQVTSGAGAGTFNVGLMAGDQDVDPALQKQWEQALNSSKATQDPTTGFRRQLEKMARSVQDQLSKIGENVGEQWNKALDESGKQTQQVNDQAAKQIAQIDMQHAIEMNARARRDALQTRQRQDTMDFQTKQQAQQLAYTYRQEDTNLLRSRGRENTERQYQFGISAEQLTHSRGLEESDIQQSRQIEDRRSVQAQQLQMSRLERDMNKDMAKAKTDDERKQIQQRYQDRREELAQSIADAKEELAIRRQYEDEDRKRRRAEEDSERQYQFEQEAKSIAHRRELEDQDLVYRRQQDAENDAFRKEQDQAAQEFRRGQEKETRELEDQLAKEAMDREKARIEQEKNDRIAAIDEALKEKQAKILKDAADERQALLKSFQERAADLKQEVSDKVPEATGDAQAKLTAFLTEIDAKVAEVTGKIAAAAASSMTALPVAAAQASLDLEQPLATIQGQFDVTDQAVELFADKFGLKWEEARPLLAEIEGGYTQTFGNVVPGAIQVTDDAVEAFAALWGITWDEARAILEAGKQHADEVLGRDIPTAAGLTDTALKNTGLAHTNLLDPMDKVKGAAGVLAEEGFGKANKAQAVLARDISTQIAAVLLRLRDGLIGEGDYHDKGLIKAVSDFHVELDELPRDIYVNVHYNNSGGPSSSVGGSPSAPSSGNGNGGGTAPPPPGGFTPGFGPGGPTHPGQSGPGGIWNNPSTGQPYAMGGIVTSPTLALVGEAGPEAIIPLSGWHRGGGGMGMAIDYDLLANKIAAALQGVQLVVGLSDTVSGIQRYVRQNGGQGSVLGLK